MIVTDRDLARLCHELADASSFGLDMEFHRDRTYFPRLCLLQVAWGTEADIVDPLAVSDLSAFYELVADPGVEKIVHAGAQDMEIVFLQGGVLPRNVFDSQIGAALVGYGDQPGYGTLIEAFFDVRLRKLETATDWMQRPLRDAQISYALDDVRYLPELRDRIGRRLSELGRTAWAAEEMSHYEERSTYERDPARAYLRIGRARTLRPRGLAILRELLAWREDEAMRRDLPRARILSDEMLVEIARRAPRGIEELEVLRGIHPRQLKRMGPGIIDAVSRALTLPDDQLPAPPPPRTDDPETLLAIDLLEVLLRTRARRESIGPSYLGTRQDLADLLGHARGERVDAPGLLHGWRRDVVGAELLELARGRVELHVDPQTGFVSTSERDAT